MNDVAKKAASLVDAKNQKGTSAVEYGMLAALIVLVILTAIQTIGTNLRTTYQQVGNAVAAPASQ